MTDTIELTAEGAAPSGGGTLRKISRDLVDGLRKGALGQAGGQVEGAW
jgi:hypothetical protein